MNARLVTPSVDQMDDLTLYKTKVTSQSIWLGFVKEGDKFINKEGDFELKDYFAKGIVQFTNFMYLNIYKESQIISTTSRTYSSWLKTVKR